MTARAAVTKASCSLNKCNLLKGDQHEKHRNDFHPDRPDCSPGRLQLGSLRSLQTACRSGTERTVERSPQVSVQTAAEKRRPDGRLFYFANLDADPWQERPLAAINRP